jgi:ATP-dependent phosphofructokinase / diphosphate-dependent phosphofructokinase
MPETRRIGILTGGGDVPGLNPVIKSVVYNATEIGCEVIGIRRGWEGLTHMRAGSELDREYLLRLDRNNTRTIDRTGGTMLHTSRTNPSKTKARRLPPHLTADQAARYQKGDDLYDLTPLVLDNISSLGLDYLVSIGGDDTLSYSKVLDGHGVPLIAIPKTMDNDVQGTEYCLGFSTAITRAKDAINRQRSTLGSHERIGVFRIFGRDAGFSALYTAYVTSARCVIPEAPFDVERLIEVLIEDKRLNPSRYAIVIASEGAMWEGGELSEFGEADAYGHRRKVDVGFALAEQIKQHSGEEAVHSELTYDLRSGEADSLDQMVSITFANIAVDLIRDGGITGRMIAIVDGKYAHVPIPEPGNPRKVDVDTMYDLDRFRPQYHDRVGRPLLLGASVGSPVAVG